MGEYMWDLRKMQVKAERRVKPRLLLHPGCNMSLFAEEADPHLKAPQQMA
jgi:hypothetical protein